MMTSMDLDVWTTLSERIGHIAISSSIAVPTSTNTATRKRKSSTIVDQTISKTTRKDPMVAAVLARQEEAEFKIFQKNDRSSLCRILELFPINSLASVSKSFCEASYLVFRRNIPDKAFVRVWKDSPLELEGGSSWLDPFSEKLHYHPALMRSQKDSVPPVREVQSVITFVTDETSELVYSIQLPHCAILGCTHKIVLRTDYQDVQLSGNDKCFSSLFIPESDNFHVKTFSLPVNFSNMHLETATTLKGNTGTFPLKALFILQYDDPPIFDANYIPRDVIVNGGIMSTSSANGPDKDLAVGVSIFADKSVDVQLYGFDFSDPDDLVFYKMQEDLLHKESGFCIFMWCWKTHDDNPSRNIKSESWETPSDEDKDQGNFNDSDFEYQKAATNEAVRRVLQKYKYLFPNIPLIGCSSTNVMFNNGFLLSKQISASFLVLSR